MSTEAGEVAVRPGAESLAEDAIDTVLSVARPMPGFRTKRPGHRNHGEALKPWRSTETMAKH